MTSVYRVEVVGGESLPIAEKIALNEKSVFPVGERLTGDAPDRFGICFKLVVYYPGVKPSEWRPDTRNTKFWGKQSSLIVDLFTSKERALECHRQSDKHHFDLRWEDESRRILEGIGPNHPVFVLGEGLLERMKKGEPLRYPYFD